MRTRTAPRPRPRRVVRSRVSSLAGVVVVLMLAAVSGGPSASADTTNVVGVPMTVTPNPVLVGSDVVLSGSGCFPGAPWVVDGGVKGITATFETTDADAAGNWSLTIHIPVGTPPGIYVAFAQCLGGGPGPQFFYSDTEFEVIDAPPTLPQLVVTPTTAAAGSTLTITGNACIFNGHVGPTTVWLGPDEGALADTIVAPTGESDWITTLVIPAGTPPGDYQVAAACEPDVGNLIIWYGAAMVTVTAATVPADPVTPAVTPVVAMPSFTG